MTKEKRKTKYAPECAGEHIRDNEVYAVLGGAETGFQLAEIADAEMESSLWGLKKTEIIGPELAEIETTSPFGLILKIKVKGESIDAAGISVRDLEAVIEKKIGDFIDQIAGVSHKYTRDEIEIRIGKEAVENGLMLADMAAVIGERTAEEFPFVSDIYIQIITDGETVQKEAERSRQIYAQRDERALSLHDEDVKTFYGCKICQISCPAHICVITPDRPSVCGTINWFEAGASCLSNPDGPVFEIEKGELLDEKGGEYTGVSKAVAAGSGGENERVLLYTLLENPHTTGFVFDVIAFYIPEAGGIGLINREEKIPAVNGLTFEEMMIFTGYGQQISGFSGVGETYLLSEKFLQKDGGWKNVVWMTQSLKDKLVKKISTLNQEKYADLLQTIRKVPTEREASVQKDLTVRQ